MCAAVPRIAAAGEFPTLEAARAAARTFSDALESEALPSPAPVAEAGLPDDPAAWTSHSSSHSRDVPRPPRSNAANCWTRTTKDRGSGVRWRRNRRAGNWCGDAAPGCSCRPRLLARRRRSAWLPRSCSHAAEARTRMKTLLMPVVSGRGAPRARAKPVRAIFRLDPG